MTDPDRYRLVCDVFDRAADLALEEREAFLAHACSGDDELRSQVEAALAEAGDERGFLATPLVAPIAAPRPLTSLGQPLPKTIAGYRIVAHLGTGGMGEVYLAEEDFPRREVALKVIRIGSLSSAALSRFEREAELLGRVEHPAIAKIHRAGTTETTVGRVAYLSMQYIPGRTLSATLSDGQPLFLAPLAKTDPPSSSTGSTARSNSALASDTPTSLAEIHQVVQWVETMALALHTAHEVGVIHRDVKPQNIMITPDNTPVLLDFGVARDVSGALADLTATGLASPGTPAYMAPEQIDEMPQRVDGRVDVWALGVVLYECLCGRRPFAGDTRAALARVITSRDPVDPRRTNGAIPKDLAAVVDRALEKDPSRRYGSAAEFAADLARVRRGEPTTARPISLLGRQWRSLSRHPWTASALLAGLSLALVVGWAGRLGREGAVDNTSAAASAFMRVAAAHDRGVAATEADWQLVREYLPDDTVRDDVLDLSAGLADFDRFMTAVTARHRGATAASDQGGVPVNGPRGGLTTLRPQWVLSGAGTDPDLGPAPDSATHLASLHDPEFATNPGHLRLEGADGVVALELTAKAGQLTWQLPTDVSLQAGGRYEWTYSDARGREQRGSFQLISAAERDERLFQLGDRIHGPINRLLRAAVLLDLELGGEALVELQQLPGDLEGPLAKRRDSLLARGLLITGQLDVARDLRGELEAGLAADLTGESR